MSQKPVVTSASKVMVGHYQEQVSVRTGPLPEASELVAYNQVIPNGADRIMKLAESQTQHRIALETTVVRSQQLQAVLGQVFGLIIGLTGLGTATYAAVQGQPWFGSVIGGATLVSLVSVFVYARQEQKKELLHKRQQIDPRLSDRKPAK